MDQNSSSTPSDSSSDNAPDEADQQAAPEEQDSEEAQVDAAEQESEDVQEVEHVEYDPEKHNHLMSSHVLEIVKTELEGLGHSITLDTIVHHYHRKH